MSESFDFDDVTSCGTPTSMTEYAPSNVSPSLITSLSGSTAHALVTGVPFHDVGGWSPGCWPRKIPLPPTAAALPPEPPWPPDEPAPGLAASGCPEKGAVRSPGNTTN